MESAESALQLLTSLVFGLCIGSFLNVCIARIPLGESVVRPRSRCPKCRKPIAGYDNIPVLSYLLLGGRCRTCKAPISSRYPAVEALSGIVALLLCLKYGVTLEWFLYFAFSAALIALAFIDMDHRILPDPITLNGIWLGLLAIVVIGAPSPLVSALLRFGGFPPASPRGTALLAGVLGILIGGGLLWLVAEAYFRIRGVEGMGFGDIKMMAMVGAFLGAPLALFTILVGSLSGSVIGLGLLQFGGKSRDYELPFGTFLGFAGILAVLYGQELIQLYLNLLFRLSQ